MKIVFDNNDFKILFKSLMDIPLECDWCGENILPGDVCKCCDCSSCKYCGTKTNKESFCVDCLFTKCFHCNSILNLLDESVECSICKWTLEPGIFCTHCNKRYCMNCYKIAKGNSMIEKDTTEVTRLQRVSIVEN